MEGLGDTLELGEIDALGLIDGEMLDETLDETLGLIDGLVLAD